MNRIATETRKFRYQGALGHVWFVTTRVSTLGALTIQLAFASGCFSPKSGPLQTKDFTTEINRPSFVGASIETVLTGKQTLIHDASIARKLLVALTPIASAKKQQEEIKGVDYVFDFQSGRDPLWISINTTSSNNKLLFQIDDYVYVGGNIKEFLKLVDEAVAPG